MRLQLVNFKAYRDYSIEFPDSGLIMLDGPSGVGKSTLLEALAFLLFDERDSTIYPRTEHKGSTVVTGTFRDYTIIRQKRPDLFKILTEGEELVGLVAENWIKARFGSADYWLASSYLRQGSKWHFLELTSAEKCCLLQELSGLDEGIYQQLSTKLAEKLTETEEQQRQTNFDVKLQEQLYLNEKASLSPEDLVRKPLGKEEIRSLISKYELGKDYLGTLSNWYEGKKKILQAHLEQAEQRHRQREENARLEQEIVRQQGQCPDYIDLTGDEAMLEHYQRCLYTAEKLQEQAQFHRLQAEYQETLAPEPVGLSRQILERWAYLLSGPSKEDLLSLQGRMKTALQYQAVLQQRQDHQRLQQQYDSLPSCFVMDPTDRISELMTILSLIDRQKNRYQCPQCKISLYLNQNQLCTTQDMGCDDSFTVQQELQQAKQEQVRYYQQLRVEEERKRLKKIIDSYVETLLPEEVPECKVPASQLQRDLYGVESLIKEHEGIRMTVIEIKEENRRQELKLKRDKLKPQLDLLQKKLAQIQLESQQVENPSDLLQQIQRYKDRLSSGKRQNDQRSKILHTIEVLERQKIVVDAGGEDSITVKQELISLEQEYQTIREQLIFQMKIIKLTQMKQRLDLLRQQEDSLGRRLSSLKKIQSTLVYAEYFILDTVISKINAKINSILEKIFKEDITVHLRAIRKLVSSDRIKPEINLTISFEGHPVKSLKGLSGGQQARVQLACCLALAKYNQSPYLLLDECMAHLDSTSREHVVDEIRKIFKEPRLILMANQDTTEGVYDRVIRLEKK